jgi:hypothetical protein
MNVVKEDNLEKQSGGEVINRLSTSTLITFNLEEYYTSGERILFDLKECLFQGIILREKDFREFIKNHPWDTYNKKYVAIACSADAIVPTWAYMLLTAALQPFAAKIIYGSLEELETELFNNKLKHVNWQQYQHAKVVIKGCSKVKVPISAYVLATNKLLQVATSIMFGEPCSTVPIFKKKKN